ncbi:helix-turn-helix domain-containing protein [Streptomyces sp. NPDC049936]|uniref:helix-turn-helix domain-containing protein n=1 Tax=Streptomyces sp. NPDC049936 TaxID=3365599 RepID=UPI0037AA49EF
MAGRRNEVLGDFLRTRRARIQPDGFGADLSGIRRVPGLRREELADRAGVSQDYYARLEQGRHPTVSASVLDSLSRALRLNAVEHAYLHTVATRSSSSHAIVMGHPTLAAVQRTLDILGSTPAVAFRADARAVAVNDAARFFFPGFEQFGHGVKWVLTSSAQELYGDAWEAAASNTIGSMRNFLGGRRASPRVESMIAELGRRNSFFRRVWEGHEVSDGLLGIQKVHHPHLGHALVTSELMTVNSLPGLYFYLVVPEEKGEFEAAMRSARLYSRQAASLPPSTS